MAHCSKAVGPTYLLKQRPINYTNYQVCTHVQSRHLPMLWPISQIKFRSTLTSRLHSSLSLWCLWKEYNISGSSHFSCGRKNFSEHCWLSETEQVCAVQSTQQQQRQSRATERFHCFRQILHWTYTMQINNSSSSSNKNVTMFNKFDGGLNEFIFSYKNRPFGMAISPSLPVPTTSLIDFNLVQQLSLPMTTWNWGLLAKYPSQPNVWSQENCREISTSRPLLWLISRTS